MALDEIIDDIRSAADQAYLELDDEEAEEFRAALADEAESQDLPDAYTSCVEDGFQIGECMEEHLNDNDITNLYEGVWDDAPEALRGALRNIGAAWTDDARAESRSIAYDNDLDDLHRHCARGNTNDVEEAVGEDAWDEATDNLNIGQVTNYKECVQVVAEAQDVRSQLRDAWGTGA
jgi:hypothetical protein